MFTSFPGAWLLPALPFVSALLISQIRPLRKLAIARYRLMWPLGLAGLTVLLAALIGVVPGVSALPVMFLAGAVSGFSLFWSPPGESGLGGRDGGGGLPPGSPPLPPLSDAPLDWRRFDRLRGEWDARRQRPRRPSPNR
jgi:hypothetical protein